MTDFDLVIRGARVISTDGEAPRCVGIRDGRITAVEPLPARLPSVRTVDLADDEVLLPGLVDSHVHVNEPGRTEWEGFASATRAAAAGGITTILDMPLNCLPPTVDVTSLRIKQQAAAGQCFIDVGFWGGAVPGNSGELRELHDAGVFGFKCFLLDSGVPEFPPLSPTQLAEYLGELAGYDALMIVHAEDPAVIAAAPAPDGRSYPAFLRSRPRRSEDVAIGHLIDAAESTGGRVHLLHLSSCEAVPAVRSARRRGIRLSVETSPHYLSFDAENIGDGATQYKCCPPIREADNRAALWRALADGDIDSVVSDHSPCTADLKRQDTGDFGAAWGGIASLQLSLPAVWTQARTRGHPLCDVARWMAQRPAEIAGLRAKGRIAPGYDADFAVFAPEETFAVDPTPLQHRNPITPYAGRTLTGVVRSTWLRGQQIAAGDPPRGRFLTRGRH
ncbi:MAG: allantoinase AllB [Mycobacteriales bacterium]